MATIPPAALVDAPAWKDREAVLDRAVRQALEPHVRPYRGGRFAGGAYAGCSARLEIAPPGDERIGRIFQGRPGLAPGTVAAVLKLGMTEAFLSTDRACLPPDRRLPVFDRYEALLEPGERPEALRIAALEVSRRLVPPETALEAMETLQACPMFQEVLRGFESQPYGSRLSERPRPAPPTGLLRRLLASRPPPALPPPPRQLKFYLDQWMPPGRYRFGDLFLDARDLKDAEVEIERDGLAWTVEFIEGTTPRHVHWRFRGTLMRALMCGKEVVLAQRFTI